MKNTYTTATVATECFVHFRKLYLSRNKVLSFGNTGKAENDGEVVEIAACFSQ
jgi:hypothetical protein